MKGIISAGGYLDIERVGGMQDQFCPLTHTMCGDWCPAFREPRTNDEGLTVLQLCRMVGLLVFDVLIDERDKKEDKEGKHD